MRHRDSWAVLGIASAAIATNGVVQADLVGSYTVGSGSSTSYLQFEFANSNP